VKCQEGPQYKHFQIFLKTNFKTDSDLFCNKSMFLSATIKTKDVINATARVKYAAKYHKQYVISKYNQDRIK